MITVDCFLTMSPYFRALMVSRAPQEEMALMYVFIFSHNLNTRNKSSLSLEKFASPLTTVA